MSNGPESFSLGRYSPTQFRSPARGNPTFATPFTLGGRLAPRLQTYTTNNGAVTVPNATGMPGAVDLSPGATGVRTNPMAPLVAAPANEKISFWQNFRGKDGRLDFGAIGAGLEGISSIGSMIAAFQQNKLAKESLAFSREQYHKNLENSTKSYNLALRDRGDARAAQNNSAAGTADAYYNKHKLTA